MILEELREQVVFYGKQLLSSGLTMNTGGNLSARDRKSGLIAIKPTSKAYSTMEPSDIAVIDIDGNLVDGNFAPSSELPMHTLIYKTYPRVCGIVHCHSIYATAAAIANVEIPLINHELCVYCSSPVRVMPFAMPGTKQLGESAIAGFGRDNLITLLQNHGSIAIGATLWHAFDGACAIERAAHAYQIAKSFGNITILPEEGRRLLRSSDPLQQPDTGEPIEINAV